MFYNTNWCSRVFMLSPPQCKCFAFSVQGCVDMCMNYLPPVPYPWLSAPVSSCRPSSSPAPLGPPSHTSCCSTTNLPGSRLSKIHWSSPLPSQCQLVCIKWSLSTCYQVISSRLYDSFRGRWTDKSLKATNERPQSNHWMTTEQPPNNHWETTEQPLNDHRATTEEPPSNHWMTTEQSLSDHRATTEWPTGNHWAPTEQSLNEHREITERALCNHWMTTKQLLSDYRATTLPPPSNHCVTTQQLLCVHLATMVGPASNHCTVRPPRNHCATTQQPLCCDPTTSVRPSSNQCVAGMNKYLKVVRTNIWIYSKNWNFLERILNIFKRLKPPGTNIPIYLWPKI